jgi:hypothetical protein
MGQNNTTKHIIFTTCFCIHMKSTVRYRTCYGRLAVVSDVDDGGFALNVDKELEGLPCYIEASTTERC